MNAVTLRRVDPSRNISRFYMLAVQPELFGGWSLVREWGWIGRPGRVYVVSYATQTEASTALMRHRRRKERRGYQ